MTLFPVIMNGLWFGCIYSNARLRLPLSPVRTLFGLFTLFVCKVLWY